MKKGKSLAALTIVCSLLLGACGSPAPAQEAAGSEASKEAAAETSEDSKEDSGEESENSGDSAAENAGESAGETSEDETLAEAVEIEVEVVNHPIRSEETRPSLVYDEKKEEYVPDPDPANVFHPGEAEYSEFLLAESCVEAYPGLDNALDILNGVLKEQGLAGLANVMEIAEESAEWQGYPFAEELTAMPMRMDGRVFSICYNGYNYYGGAHPNTYYDCLTLNTETGKALNLSDVVVDPLELTEPLAENLIPVYAEESGEEHSFTKSEMGSMTEIIRRELEEDEVKWVLTDTGLRALFSPYELASYSEGPIVSVLSWEEYPELFVEGLYPTEGSSTEKRVTISDAPVEEYTAEELSDYKGGAAQEEEPTEGSYAGDVQTIQVRNPGWGMSYHDELIDEELPPVPLHLKEAYQDKQDWIDPTIWSAEQGIELPDALPYSDGSYSYSRGEADQLGLYVQSMETGEIFYYDLSEFSAPPDNTGGTFGSAAVMNVGYALVRDDMLYVSLYHPTYASAQPHNAFILAIEMSTGTVMWKSEELVANSVNFVIEENAIICGYGFTKEDDFIYVLSLENGKTWDKYKINSKADYFIPLGDSLIVITYNTVYEYKIEYTE